jgi:hypothetical protein
VLHVRAQQQRPVDVEQQQHGVHGTAGDPQFAHETLDTSRGL